MAGTAGGISSYTEPGPAVLHRRLDLQGSRMPRFTRELFSLNNATSSADRCPPVDPPWNGSGGRQAGCVGFVGFFGRLGAGVLDRPPVAADPIWNLSACKRLRCGATCVGRGSSTES